MSQKLSFDIKFQKQIDRCQSIAYAYSAIGLPARKSMMLIQEVVDDARKALEKNNIVEIIRLYNIMKEIKK